MGGEGFESMFADMMGEGAFGRGGGGGGGRKNRPRTGMDGGGKEKRSQDSRPPSKDDPSGLVLLGQAKFPDVRAKHAWLILFYHHDMYTDQDVKTRQYVSMARELSEGLLKKAKNKKNEMIFKVGAIDCSGDRGEAMKFCHSKISQNGKGVAFPVFATVLNGDVRVITEDGALQNARTLHDRTTYSLLKIEGLVVNVDSAEDVQSRLLASSPTPGHPCIAILLLTDKSKTSPLYASLAYRHRQDGFAAFGEIRGNNLQLRNKQFSVEEYPLLLALIGNDEKVEKYNGALSDSESISNWLNGLAKRYFKSKSKRDSRRTTQRA